MTKRQSKVIKDLKEQIKILKKYKTKCKILNNEIFRKDILIIKLEKELKKIPNFAFVKNPEKADLEMTDLYTKIDEIFGEKLI